MYSDAKTAMTTIQMTRFPDADEALRVLRLGVDLVGPECALAVGAHDRRVDLEDMVDAKPVLDRVLFAA